MVFVPMAQTPPMAGAKEVLYSLNLIHEFTSLLSPQVIFAGSLRKAFLQKHAFVDISVFLWLRKEQPDEMNCSIKVWPLVWHAQWRNLQRFDFRPSSTKQCSKSTVRPKRFLFTWESTVKHKPLPRLTQNKCYTVYTRNLIHAFTSVS